MTRPAVLVTGAARRIGAAIANRFAHAGWHVVIHCRSADEEAEALAGSLPSAEAIACDFAVPGAATEMIAALAGRLEDWRCLIANAAVFRQDLPLAFDHGVAAEAMQVNAIAQAELASAYLKHARAPSGRRLVVLTDQKLANPNPDFFSYTMSKHAAAAMVPMLAMAAGAKDRVHALAPGAILASHDQSEDEAEHSHKLNLLGRRTSPDEVADAAFFLATGPLASGEGLFVDSGQHLVSQDRDVIYLARGEH